MIVARVLAVLLVACLAFAWGRRTGYETGHPWELTDYDGIDAAQMSWVIEGLQERISELQTRLVRATEAQQEKLAAEKEARAWCVLRSQNVVKGAEMP